MLKLAIIIGSTRPGRVGEEVANWVYHNVEMRRSSWLISKTSNCRSSTNQFHPRKGNI
jgi:hypothetical protein